MDSENHLIYTPAITDYPCFEPYHIDKHDWQDGILIRTPNWLGDAVMIFPAIAMLKRCMPPQCGIFIVCPKNLAPLFDEMKEVSVVIPLQNAHAFPKRKEFKGLIGFHISAVLIFNNSFRDVLAFHLLGFHTIFGVRARNRDWLLSVKWSSPKRLRCELNPYHQSAVYLAMVKALGADVWDGSMPTFTFEQENCRTFQAAYPELFSTSQKIMLLAPGAAYGDAKRWDSEKFHEVARWWIEQMNGTAVVIGTAGERDVAEDTAKGLPADRCYNLAGKTSLKQLMMLICQTKICVCNDSGTMHLAAALGTAGVALFGSTDPVATSPVAPKKNWKLLYGKCECSPCFRRVCPLGTKACFEKLTVDSVKETIESILKGND